MAVELSPVSQDVTNLRSDQLKLLFLSGFYLGIFPLILFLFSFDYHLETTYPVNIFFVLKMLSAYYACCLHLSKFY